MKQIKTIIILLIPCIMLAQNGNLQYVDIVLIKEAFNLQKELGQEVWDNWNAQDVPLMYKKGKFSYLFHHPDPPEGYSELYKLKYSTPIYFKKTQDSISYHATFPVNNIFTVVVSSPEKDDNTSVWVLKTVHEMFHVFQDKKISNELKDKHNFRKGIFENTNELNFPFDYFNEERLTIERIAAEKVYTTLIDSLTDSSIKVFRRRFRDIYFIQELLVEDSLQLKYKSHMEWYEGVARYVEHKLAELSSSSKNYSPTAEYQKFYPNADYTKLNKRYQRSSTINPIRFVGEGVIGKLMFYYMGMGKALLLDKIKPEWKNNYFCKTLDEQIIGEEQFLECKN